MPAMGYLAAVMALWQQGLDIFSSLEKLPLWSITLPYTQPHPSSRSSYIQLLLNSSIRKKWSHLLYPSKVRSVLSASCFEDLLLCNASILIFPSVLGRCVLLPLSTPSGGTHSLSVQHMKVLHAQISDLAILHTRFPRAVPFLAYTILVSVLLPCALPWVFLILSPPLFFFMTGSETNSAFWHWVRMTQNPARE